MTATETNIVPPSPPHTNTDSNSATAMSSSSSPSSPASKKQKLNGGGSNTTATTTATTTTTKATTTPKASDVYDRQIRLWGAESQAKMQKAKILYIHITGLSAEVIKNLVLAGIAASILDPRPAETCLFGESTAPHFLTPTSKSTSESSSSTTTVAQAVQPMIQELNPLLGCCDIVSKTTISELTVKDIQDYTAIVASQISKDDAIYISKLIAEKKHQYKNKTTLTDADATDTTDATDASTFFYVADCFGLYGAVAIDLQEDFEYRPEQGKTLLDPVRLSSSPSSTTTTTSTSSSSKPSHVPMESILTLPLSQATNRFHKSPPKAWVLYRTLMEYYTIQKQWPGEETPTKEEEENKSFDSSIVETFLKDQGILEGSRNNNLDINEIISLVKDVGMAQIAPVCAVLGGLLGNEIIKAISGKGEPANNTLLFDGTLCKAWSFLVQQPSSSK